MDYRGDQLEAQKAALRNRCGDPISRLANTAVHLETLRRRADETLPGRDASAVAAAIQPMINAVDQARQSLIAARDQIDDILHIPQGDSDE